MADAGGAGGGAPAGGGNASAGQAPAAAGPAATSEGTGAPGVGAAGGEAPKPAETAAQRLTRKLKIDGQEREFPLEMLDTYAQRGMAADKRFFEADQLRKTTEGREAKLKDKPWDAIKEAGHDPLALAQQLLIEHFEGQALTPEQQKIKALEADKAKWEADQKTTAEKARQVEIDQHAEKSAVEYTTKFVAALKAAGVPEGLHAAGMIARMAKYEAVNAESGINAPPEVLAELVKEDLQSEQRHAFGGLEGDVLLSAMGDELTDKVVKAAVARFERKSKGALPAPPKPVVATGERNGKGQFVSRDEQRFNWVMNRR